MGSSDDIQSVGIQDRRRIDGIDEREKVGITEGRIGTEATTDHPSVCREVMCEVRQFLVGMDNDFGWAFASDDCMDFLRNP